MRNYLPVPRDGAHLARMGNLLRKRSSSCGELFRRCPSDFVSLKKSPAL